MKVHKERILEEFTNNHLVMHLRKGKDNFLSLPRDDKGRPELTQTLRQADLDRGSAIGFFYGVAAVLGLEEAQKLDREAGQTTDELIKTKAVKELELRLRMPVRDKQGNFIPPNNRFKDW